MHVSRTRFKKEIVAEFLPPAKKSNKVIILCGGMPSYPGKKEDLMEFLAKKGYWTFIPRYRGTWESGGEFLKTSPHQDVIDVIDGIQSGFTDLWSGTNYKLPVPNFYLIGSSFGGPAAILASRDKRVKRVIALSPVIDWTKEIKTLDLERDFTKSAFGAAYRLNRKNWNKLKTGKFYNPMNEVNKLNGKKLLIIHAKDDKVVSYRPSQEFARVTGCKLLVLPTGGHLSTSDLPKFWKKIARFID